MRQPLWQTTPETQEKVQRAMRERLRASNKTLKDLGVKQAPFVVLIGAAPFARAHLGFCLPRRL